MALTADTFVGEWVSTTPVFQEWLVKTATAIFRGAGLCLEQADGYARNVAASLTAPVFLGFAERPSPSNGGASGTLSVLTRVEDILKLPAASISTVAVTDIGATIYMSDENTFTKTSTNNVPIGKLLNLIGGFAYIHVQAGPRRSI